MLVEFSTFLNYAQSLRFEDKPDYPFLRKLFRELFIREKFELDFLYDWTQANKVTLIHTDQPNLHKLDQQTSDRVEAKPRNERLATDESER